MTNDSDAERRKQELVNKRIERINKPDGLCYQCEKPADRYAPVGPIIITVTEPGDEIFAHEFCCWECIGHWFAVQAGWETPYANQDGYPPLDRKPEHDDDASL
jgi:hypothetical protein